VGDEFSQIIVAATITGLIVTWRPDWETVVGLFGWGIVAAVMADKVRVWLQYRNDPNDA
jgi:hypothetical protein